MAARRASGPAPAGAPHDGAPERATPQDPELHPVLAAAAAGRLPRWAEAGPARRAHLARVAHLLGRWAEALRLPPAEVARWQAAGWLHDALRDADPEPLRDDVAPALQDLPGPLLHGPATAARLAREGVRDAELLDAIAYHTLGHPRLGRLGRALYLADYLEPGRPFDPAWRAALRARLPAALEPVLREVVAARLTHRIRAHGALRPETVDFWNALARTG